VTPCQFSALTLDTTVATVLQVFVLVGPTGAGRSSLARLLLRDFPEKLLAVPLLTNR
jgi:guanylate kinase